MLIEASIADISGLIPNLTTDAASHEVGDMLYEVSSGWTVTSIQSAGWPSHGR